MDKMEDAMDYSSDSDSSDNQDEAMEQRCKEIESELFNNKYMYDLHIELTELYEKLADLNSLRAAYQRFHECFPLTPKLWLKWIKQEITIAASDQEKQHVLELFNLAVVDYLSIELWQAYTEYAMEMGGVEKSREVLEKALSNAGLHASGAVLLWDYLREIELVKLSIATHGTDAWREQAMKVLKVFQRQLSVPLIGMESTYNEWIEWKKSLPSDFKFDPEPVEWGYQKALKELESYKPYEDELLAAKDDTEIYEIFKKYIAIVKDPQTVMCLYERAVAQLSLNPTLWLDYCKYVYKLGDVALTISERSLRNCTWTEELWVMKLRIMENLGKNESELMSSFEQGLTNIAPSPGVQLWFAYIEFIRRNNPEEDKFYKLLEKASEVCGEFDTQYSFARFHARFLAKKGNLKETMSIWNTIVGNPQNKGNLTFWLEYLALIKQYGKVDQIRSLYQKALKTCKDWAYYIAEEWLLFEREFGTLASVMECAEKCKDVNTSYQQSNEQTSQQQNNQQTSQRQNSQRAANNQDIQKGKKRKYNQEQMPDTDKQQRKIERVQEPKKPIEKDPSKTVFVSNMGPEVDESMLQKMFPNAVNIEVCYDRKGKSKCFGYIQFTMEEEVMTALARDRENLNNRPIFISNCKPDKNERKPVFKYSTAIEENKLFVRGLPRTLTKDEVQEIFKPYGATDTRIVIHKNGQSKGLAYIEFPDSESTKKALTQTDQMQFGENVISVAISAPPPKKSADEKPPETTRNSKTRLQVPFIPRSVQKKTEQPSDEQKNVEKPKSNDDFRKMLLNK